MKQYNKPEHTRHEENSPKREADSSECLYQKDRAILNTYCNNASHDLRKSKHNPRKYKRRNYTDKSRNQ